MASSFFSLHIPFISFIILLVISWSNGKNDKYTACQFTFSCGYIQHVGYPFWGGDRPQFCGIPDFKLSCHENDGDNYYPLMNIYKDGYFPLKVLGIDDSLQTITMNNTQENIMHCPLENRRRNATLLSTLKPADGYTKISLFYGCGACVSRYHPKSFRCSNHNDGTNANAYYFDNSSDISRLYKSSCSCKNNVPVVIDMRGLDELTKSTNASFLTVINKLPNVRMKYMANFAPCSLCKKSGGRCGSSDDSSADQFVCYCRDGKNAQVCSESVKKKMEIALGLGVGGGFFIIIVAIIAVWCCKKFKFGRSKFRAWNSSLDISASDLEKGSRYFGVSLFSYNDLVEATKNFNHSKELGSGGFGTVYYGKLKDGREVAVKRLYEKSYKRMEQFMNEVRILTRLRHQNLVSLYGCTSQHCRELLLVYEYVKNGTVADHLYGENPNSSVLLPWPIRLRIAIETATALSYLHASDIIHRDVKTNNILLDSNFSVKVADFGLSRLFPIDKTHVSTAPQGTPGYVDPEYHQCYQLTDKSDVYSFGVVLVELISSLPAIDMERNRHEINLSNFAMNRIQRCAFDELVDPQLGFASDFKVRRMSMSVAELAFQCLQHDKEFRPSMDEVLEVLQSIEGADYEALLLAEETVNNAKEEVVKMDSSNTLPPSPEVDKEDNHAQLLSNNHQLHPPSPISVMDKWINSRSTISCNSK